jgi:peptide/nickel transport system ATP-binding protein
MTPPLLEARSLRKVYTKGGGLFGGAPSSVNVALDEFSFRFDGDSPAFIAIAGESGSGKTTLAQLLLGFVRPTDGQVLYRGRDIHALGRAEQLEYRREVQAVFQDPFAVYNPFYKVDHILHTPIRKFNLAQTRDQAEALILEALSAVGLRAEDTLGRYPHQLSGGQRQRITVARALLLRPKLVIADEPVSMVDASLRASILESLYRVHQDFGISFIYITHDLTTAYQVSSSIVVLYRGRVAEAGDIDAVIRTPQHPYTQELIRSIPAPNPGQGWMADEDRSDSEGVTASTGCAFASRCPHVMPRCTQTPPPAYQVRPDQVALCYLHDDKAMLTGRDLTPILTAQAEQPAHKMLSVDHSRARVMHRTDK